MITLLLDTSFDGLLIAIVKDNSILYEFSKKYEHDMSKYLVSELELAFEGANIDSTDIDNIVVAIGPGSFTGVRMGVTVAKTLAFVNKTKLFAISSLLLMATTLDQKNKAVCFDARRNYVYGAVYDKNNQILLADQYLEKEAFLKHAANHQATIISNMEIGEVKSKYNILTAIKIALQNEAMNPHALKPNYLKETQAERELKEKNDHTAK